MPLFAKIEESMAKSLKERFAGKQEVSMASSIVAKSNNKQKNPRRRKHNMRDSYLALLQWFPVECYMM